MIGRRRVFLFVFATLMIGWGLGNAVAQEGSSVGEGDADGSAEGSSAAGSSAAGGGGSAEAGFDGSEPVEGEVGVRRRADLSGPEQMAESERIVERGNQISRRVSGMLAEARRERDIIRVTCLNDKLTQVNANLRTAEHRIAALQEAVQGDDGSRRNHEFTVLTVLGQKFNVLEQEANQCIGQDIFETGATRIVTEIDPATPTEDPSILAQPPGTDVPFIPPPASGTT